MDTEVNKFLLGIGLDPYLKQLSFFASDDFRNRSAYRRREEDVRVLFVCQNRGSGQNLIAFLYKKSWYKTLEISRFYSDNVRYDRLSGFLDCCS